MIGESVRPKSLSEARRSRGTSYFSALPAEERSSLFDEIANLTKAFDAEHGTDIYNAMIKAGFPGP